MTVVEIPSGTHMTEQWLGGRFRLDERIGLDDPGRGTPGPVPHAVIDAVQSAAKVSDPRLATIYDSDFDEQCAYIVAEWTPGTHLEDLVLTGLPNPALAAAMIADAADALAVAHQAGRPHLRLTPRSLRWDPSCA